MASPMPVSWQSALGGLVPLAINSMCQPSGKVCDAPRAIGPLMRISPIICFLDMLSILCRLVFYSIRKRSIREACTLVMTQRYAYDHDSADSAIAEFKHNAPLRWISFLASVFQIVRLFAAQGLLWTKIWGSMYLASFLVVELQVFISRKWLPSTWPPTELPAELIHIPRTRGARSLPYISIAASVIFACFFIIYATASVFKHYGRNFNTLDCTGMILLTCGGVIFIPCSYYSAIFRTDRNLVSRAGKFSVAVIAVPAIYLLALLQHKSNPLEPWITNIIVPSLIAIWALLCLAWASVTFGRADIGTPGSLRRLEVVLATYFFGLNIMAALLYYGFSYDPTGTVEPEWTQLLLG